MLKNKSLITDSEIKSYDPESHTIVSYVSTKDPDYVGDIVLPSGLNLKKMSDGSAKPPVVLDNHDSKKVVGKNLWIKSDEYGILAKTEFAQTERGKELEYLYANKFMTDFSIRIEALEKGYEENELGGVTFKDYIIPEYSFVGMGCNWNAVSKTKSMDEIKDAYSKIKSTDIKKDFENYFTTKAMEEKLTDLENRIKELENRFETIEKSLVEVKETPVIEEVVIENAPEAIEEKKVDEIDEEVKKRLDAIKQLEKKLSYFI